MKKVHMILQGKGGTGKTTNSAFIAQYLTDKGKSPLCIDTDPVNASFAAYRSMNVKTFSIMDGGEIDPRSWDNLIEMICTTTTQDVVVDNGATSFVSLLSYMQGNISIETLTSFGKEVVIHIPIAGSESLGHTLMGMVQIIDKLQAQNPKFVVWLNPFLGKIEIEGKGFETFPEYKENRKKIASLVYVPEFTPAATFGRDMTELLKNNITFSEALEMKEVKNDDGTSIAKSVKGYPIAMLQRIAIIQKRLFGVLDASGIF